MIRLRAAWVLPIAGPPVRNGWVEVEAGRVRRIGEGRVADSAPELDLGARAVLPGLVNAHTHLELSWLRGRIPPQPSFLAWVQQLIWLRADPPADAASAVASAIEAMRACGTALVGDISNTLASVEALRASPLAAVVFKELIRFKADDPGAMVRDARRDIDAANPTDRLRLSLAAHAPYSVSPALFQAINAELARLPGLPCSVHLGEAPEEIELLRSGSGPWRDLLAALDAWDAAWVPPRCGAAEYIDRLGCLDHRTIVVHGVQLDAAELERIGRRGATLVTCPRSNRWTGAGDPPLDRFYASGVRVAVGTDSLASAADLNLFSELAAMRRLAPAIPAATLLRSATWEGARALGFQPELGTIEPGKRADLIAVEVPAGAFDVEEYLVDGVEPEQIQWVPAS